MGWPDTNQSFEDSPAQRRPPISYILEFFVVAHIANVGKAVEKAVNIISAQQFVNHGHISQQPRTSLKSTEKCYSDTFRRFLSGLDNGRAVEGEPSHQIGV